MRVAALGTLTGLVTDANGAPVTNAWVNLEGRFPGRAGPGEGPLSAHTDAQGRYTIFNASPGSYRPIVYADNYTRSRPSGPVTSRSTTVRCSVPAPSRAGRSSCVSTTTRRV